jgi:predicted MPP superfamily phosphohydrolase
MKPSMKLRLPYYLFLASGLVVMALLYIGLLTALPKYAGRVPLLAILFIVDWLIYADVRKFWLKYSTFVKAAFAAFWWMPVFLMFLFLVGSIVKPLQEWNDWPRIYLPGLALIAVLSKIAMFVGLLPAYLLKFTSYLSSIGRQAARWNFTKAIHFFKITGNILSAFLLMLMLTGSVYWVYNFKIHEVNIPLKQLPPQFEGLRIVQLSDIHLGSWVSAKPLQRAVDKVLALKPDIIVFTGDMVNYSTDEVQGFESTLSQLKAPMGVFAILGNHDYGDYTPWESEAAKAKNMADLELFYDKIGWKLLRNESEIIRIDSALLLISGVENWSATPRFRKYGDMGITMKQAVKADVSILLSHDPTHWDAEVTESYPQFDLTLSGHTHGMQMGIEMFGISWSPSQYIYKEWAGLYSHISSMGKTNYLYVNRGLGHIGYPGRVGILPEITLITFSKSE